LDFAGTTSIGDLVPHAVEKAQQGRFSLTRWSCNRRQRIAVEYGADVIEHRPCAVEEIDTVKNYFFIIIR